MGLWEHVFLDVGGEIVEPLSHTLKKSKSGLSTVFHELSQNEKGQIQRLARVRNGAWIQFKGQAQRRRFREASCFKREEAVLFQGKP